jgi:hypothetical protein
VPEVTRGRRVLASLTPEEHEALYRFYCLHESSSRIEKDLSINRVKFRELKSRVKKELARAALPN